MAEEIQLVLLFLVSLVIAFVVALHTPLGY
jgi:hypothetical protein